ncbi:hypothetical protein D1007_04196 [Hordeum vulgare]|nr:hypothetical protein D1007_04196 [Hordeum vulgare]
MWRELHSTVVDKKVHIYGPYLFKLIEDTCVAEFLDEYHVTEHMVTHGVLKLHVKENWGIAPAFPEIVPTNSYDEEEPDYTYDAPYETEPSWATKLKSKMKKLLYFQAPGQYKAHVEAKQARSHDKKIMMKLGLGVHSGYEEKISDEEDWVKKNCPWTESDEE